MLKKSIWRCSLLPVCLETYDIVPLISEKNSLLRLELLHLQPSEDTQGFYWIESRLLQREATIKKGPICFSLVQKLVSKGKVNFKVSHIHEKINILNYRLQIKISTPQIVRSSLLVYFTTILHPLLWNCQSDHKNNKLFSSRLVYQNPQWMNFTNNSKQNL